MIFKYNGQESLICLNRQGVVDIYSSSPANSIKIAISTGKTQRDRVEWEVGGGIGMGSTCKSMANSCQCMTKPSTIL